MNLYNWTKNYFLHYYKNKKIVLVIDDSIVSFIYAKLIKNNLKKNNFKKNIEIINYKIIKYKKVKKEVFFVVSFRKLEEILLFMDDKNLKQGIDFYTWPIIYFNKEIFTPRIEWKDIEQFGAGWEIRTIEMSKLIDKNIRLIIDLGCGEGKLRKYLEKNISYLGVDYKKRNDNTIICDFNKNEFPNIALNEGCCYFCSGILEYINNIDLFIRKMRGAGQIIISYCPIEYNRNNRRKLAWKNNLTVVELVVKFINNNYICVDSTIINNNIILSFKSSQ